MKIYVAHPSGIDFRERLYRPIRKSDIFEDHSFVFPHEKSVEPFNSRDFLKEECDLVVAEVSEPSTGAGIELGWADVFEVPIICLCRKGSEASGSLQNLDCRVESYRDAEELVEIIGRQLD